MRRREGQGRQKFRNTKRKEKIAAYDAVCSLAFPDPSCRPSNLTPGRAGLLIRKAFGML